MTRHALVENLLSFGRIASRSLTGGEAIEFGKNNQNEWQILKPKPLRADGLQVDELVRKLKVAKMDTSVSDEDAKKALERLRCPYAIKDKRGNLVTNLCF